MVKAKAKTKSRTKRAKSNVLSAEVSLAVIAIAIVVTAITFALALTSHTSKAPSSQVNSFKECVEAGYPVQESYPERCAVPNGTTFINPDQAVRE